MSKQLRACVEDPMEQPRKQILRIDKLKHELAFDGWQVGRFCFCRCNRLEPSVVAKGQ